MLLEVDAEVRRRFKSLENTDAASRNHLRDKMISNKLQLYRLIYLHKLQLQIVRLFGFLSLEIFDTSLEDAIIKRLCNSVDPRH